MRKTTFGCTSAVRHMVLLMTLLFGFGIAGVYAQSQTEDIPAGLSMNKTWIPDPSDPTGSTGKVVLETYVTGATITSHASVPNDIVIVVDQSGSMAYDFNGNTTYTDANRRITALKNAVTDFCSTVQQDAKSHNVNHKIAIVGFANANYRQNNQYWTNTELLSSAQVHRYATTNTTTSSLTAANYRDALVEANVNDAVNTRLTTAVTRIEAEGGTMMQYGLIMAKGVLDNRTETTFTAPDGTQKPRGQIVIFFTDGYPGYQNYNGYFYDGTGNSTYNNRSTADATVQQANLLKQAGATVYSIGIFGGADPAAAYQTTQTNGNNTYTNRWYTDIQCANGLLHMVSSNYDGQNVALATSWAAQTTSAANVANRFVYTTTDPETGEEVQVKGKYFAAANASDLSSVFSEIADQSGAEPLELNAQTLVQDEVSSSFMLPEGADINSIEVYAVKCTAATVDDEGNVTSCEFNTPDADTFVTPDGTVSFGTKTTYASDGTTIQYLTLDADGVVVEGDNLPENRLNPDGIVTLTTDPQTGREQVKLQGFNFKNMFCGLVGEEPNVEPTGRKLVIVIPLEVQPGVWGDGMITNGPMSFVLPDGSSVAYSFTPPVTNVIGTVWTEVVTYQPSTFDPTANPIPLTTPEDLAWFISWVNGRANYSVNSGVTPHVNANAILMADLDMSAHNWVSIGEETSGYTGTFDGNGHVISGLKNNAAKFFKLGNNAVVYPGMFSNVKGIVHDVFVLDSDFRSKNHLLSVDDEHKTFIHFGIIADTLSSGGQIYNCEAVGRLSSNREAKNLSRDSEMIFGGLVGLNNGGTIHSCMAMAELIGYTMGGAVGENRGGTFSNSFTNGVYTYYNFKLNDQTIVKPVGGLAGINSGTINNCYVRFERNNRNLDIANFNMLVGSGSAATNCYTPELYTYERPSVTGVPIQININESVPNNGAMNPYTLTVSPTRFNFFTNDNMTGGSWGEWEGFPVYEGGSTLLTLLNNGRGNGAEWKRTTAGGYDFAHGAGDINDDYPVLKLSGYTCLASADGIRIDYAHNISDMLKRHNTGAMNENTNLADSCYKVNNHETINGGSINLYANDDNRSLNGVQKVQNTDEDVVVYIDENIGLLQDVNSAIEAYTGQTMLSFVKDGKERWHTVSSSLSNSQFGWYYEEEGQMEHTWEANPCGFTMVQTDEDRALFPIDLISYKRADFYCYYEPQYHWINFKRNSASHYHMDNWDSNIPIVYDNETAFEQGKGYLLAIDVDYWQTEGFEKDAQFLQNRGTLTTGNISRAVTAQTPASEWKVKGYNLLGNPYQSFLDFDAFVNGNPGLWSGSDFAQTYAVYDPNEGNYIQYKSGSSKGSRAAGQYLSMHQGFFIQVGNDGTANFTNDMRSLQTTPTFRGEQPAYPLINFFVTDREGRKDLAILELNRPENDGAKKLIMGTPAGRIYFRYDDENLAIFFRDNAKDYQSLNFAAEENGVFTLSWERANDNFGSLTLVDNITGVKTDMLTHDHYIFEGNTEDYKTRFKIVFDLNNNNDAEVETESFAFFSGDNLVINGTGHFEVIDVLGRVLYTAELNDTQTTISLPSNAKGVCMLSLTNGNDVKVQKIMVR